MVNDHLSDFVARIKNGYTARRATIESPAVKILVEVANVLAKSGYLSKVTIESPKKMILDLKYTDREPAVMGIRRISTPGGRIYVKSTNIGQVWGGLGISILSTPRGIMSSKEAKRANLGGEVICEVW